MPETPPNTPVDSVRRLSERYRLRCPTCGWIGRWSELLTAPDPFIEKSRIRACPKCKDVFGTQQEHLCETDDCPERAGGGYPFPNGEYRFLCYKHAPK